jgi:hypothetical protein
VVTTHALYNKISTRAHRLLGVGLLDTNAPAEVDHASDGTDSDISEEREVRLICERTRTIQTNG